ncbi:hypothetical protein [Paraburkholderia sp. BL17N1]|uniref:hypothetical protein n=1 Tax=Paraburkholderia sp. BL17N1 TaxID=1938798 RepID=UPI0011C3E5E8|nr:hypothetical protein [Paraburkholderia sp. BL17N1]
MPEDDDKPIPKFWQWLVDQIRGVTKVLVVLALAVSAGLALYQKIAGNTEAKDANNPAVADPCKDPDPPIYCRGN